MKLMIRSHDPAWDVEYDVCTEQQESFLVKTSREGNFHHLRMLDAGGTQIGHVYQNRTGVTGECGGRELLTVDLLMGMFHRMIPEIRSRYFRSCRMQFGDIKRREYMLDINGCQVCVYPSGQGVAVKSPDQPAPAAEILVLVLAIEAVTQYT